MRRVSPASILRRRVHPIPHQRQSRFDRGSRPLPNRTFSSTSTQRLPRSINRLSLSSYAASNDGVGGSETPGAEADEEGGVEDGGDSAAVAGKPPPSSFPFAVTSVIAPDITTDPLPDHLRTLHAHLLTLLLPASQPVQPISPATKTTYAKPPIAFATAIPSNVLLDNPSSEPERALALVTPFEGGIQYITEAVEQVAAALDADIVRLDLALAIGFDGVNSPLGYSDHPAPPIPLPLNPLFYDSVPSSGPVLPDAAREMEEATERDEEEVEMRSGVVMMPWTGRPDNHDSLPGAPPFSGSDERWIAFFDRFVNQPAVSGRPRPRRILLLEGAEAMSSSMEIWWPSLVEAVRRRRRDGIRTPPKTKAPHQPTTIVFASSPSMLRPHTATIDTGDGDERSAGIRQAMNDIAERLGGTVVTSQAPEDKVPLWWGSAEKDAAGRVKREEQRLQLLIEGRQVSELLPWMSQSRRKTPASGNPLLQLLASQFDRNASISPASSTCSISLKILPILPVVRSTGQEAHERAVKRQIVSTALLSRAVAQFGGVLLDPLAILSRLSAADRSWRETVISWEDARNLASSAIGRAAVKSADPLEISWDEIARAQEAEETEASDMRKRLEQYRPASVKPKRILKRRSTGDESAVDKVRKARDLSSHEKRLLSCIVDTSKLAAATFGDIHLPFKTIDAVRTVVSLPLLFPEAFQGGILKDHATSGALLFGPPGTGKTLLARAVANESGARMLAVQPSDVNDKYFGEGEKLVKAVFSLARRLSPCVVFLDEVDALFGARSARGNSSGHKAHDQLLTEFMQEMDGLSSASANLEKRVVVIGATNRPFDLDDAVLRRLPRRLLVDLPDVKDRIAILRILLRDETLDGDVDMTRLAHETDGFSGSDLKHVCVTAALSAIKESVKVPWLQIGGDDDALRSEEAKEPDQVSRTELDQPTDGSTSNTSEGEAKIETKEALPVIRPPRVLYRRHFERALSEIRPSSSEEGTLPELRKWAEQFGEGGQLKTRRKAFGKAFGFGEKGVHTGSFGRVEQGD